MPTPIAEPLLVRPRLDSKPWGGRGLAFFGFDLPAKTPIGEALLTASEAIVESGSHAGRSLGELTAEQPEAIAGRLGLRATGEEPLFPLLVKLIEATGDLSIQVHPDDLAARRSGDGPLGKTEAWHVLTANPAAELYMGIAASVALDRFTAAIRTGMPVGPLMRRLPARPGTTLLIPAGTVHALGAGTLVYEVQQPSEITYRLDDWGRVDAQGQPRTLHLDAGLAAARVDKRPEFDSPIELRVPAGRRLLLVACRYFGLERLALPAGGVVDLSAMASAQVITCLNGEADIRTSAGGVRLHSGKTVVVPAAGSPARLLAVSPTTLLRAWAPDRDSEILAPARRAGADEATLGRLADRFADAST